MMSKNSIAIMGKLTLCGQVGKKAPSMAVSKRFLSHESFNCKCLMCASAVTSFPSKMTNASGSASFHASSQSSSPLILAKSNALETPRSREVSELFTLKREFSFQSTEVEDAKHINNLLENNKKWAKDLETNSPEEYKKLSIGQTPKYLYFGCSDSRVPANQVLGLGPGEVFVHRNVGNLVPGSDLNVLSVLEFAVGHLGVTDIIVTGHYNCGAVRASVTRQDLGTLENWLRSIRDVYRLHRDYLDSIKDEEERHKKLVELNVVEQCINIYKTGIVQRKRLENKKAGKDDLKNAPRIHGLVFDMPKGLLQRLTVDYSKVGDLDKIYGLY